MIRKIKRTDLLNLKETQNNVDKIYTESCELCSIFFSKMIDKKLKVEFNSPKKRFRQKQIVLELKGTNLLDVKV